MRPSTTAHPPSHRTTSAPRPEISPISGENAAWIRARPRLRARYSRVQQPERLHLARLHRVGAHHRHPGQVLLHLGGEHAELLLHAGGAVLHVAAERAREQHEGGERRHRHQGEPRIDEPHGDGRPREGEQRADEHHGAEARDLPDRGDVAGGARHEVAGAVPLVEGRRQLGEARVEVATDVVLHPLAGADHREPRAEPGRPVEQGQRDDDQRGAHDGGVPAPPRRACRSPPSPSTGSRARRARRRPGTPPRPRSDTDSGASTRGCGATETPDQYSAGVASETGPRRRAGAAARRDTATAPRTRRTPSASPPRALAEAHRVTVERLQLEALAVDEVVVQRRERPGRERVELAHARVREVGRERHALRAPERGHLLEQAPVHPARLGQLADRADRAPQQRGHAGVRSQEHVLLPEGADDAGRDLGGDPRALERGEEGARAWRHAIVHLPEGDAPAARWPMTPGSSMMAKTTATPPSTAPGPSSRPRIVLVVHAVLDGEHRRLGPDDGPHRRRRGLRVVRLHAEQHEVGWGQPVEPLDDRRPRDPLSLGRRAHEEPARADRLEVRSPRHERHVLAGSRSASPRSTRRSHPSPSRRCAWRRPCCARAPRLSSELRVMVYAGGMGWRRPASVRVAASRASS